MKHVSLPTAVSVLATLVVAFGILTYIHHRTAMLEPPTACTLEAKLCPDGSYVGRTGPNCQFAACPSVATTSPSGAPIVGEGEHCGGFIQNAPLCAVGLHCQLVVSRPDTGGTCVPDSTSGVRGTITTGPTCPVEHVPPDPQCADKPYSTTVTVFRANNLTTPYTSTQSATDGTFEISLPPDTYSLSAGGSGLPRCERSSFTVSPHSYARVTISCDTGIR